MVISNDVIEAFLDAFLGAGTFNAGGAVYLGLLTDEPINNGTGYTEPAGGSYARISKTDNSTNFPACTPGTRTKANGTVCTWPTATAGWGAVVGVGVFTGASGGAAHAFAPMPTPETVNSGNVVSLAVGQLQFTAL